LFINLLSSLKMFWWKLFHFIIPNKVLLFKWKIVRNSVYNQYVSNTPNTWHMTTNMSAILQAHDIWQPICHIVVYIVLQKINMLILMFISYLYYNLPNCIWLSCRSYAQHCQKSFTERFTHQNINPYI
jgi:hypothetical protein